jgi:hypothetical protein
MDSLLRERKENQRKMNENMNIRNSLKGGLRLGIEKFEQEIDRELERCVDDKRIVFEYLKELNEKYNQLILDRKSGVRELKEHLENDKNKLGEEMCVIGAERKKIEGQIKAFL